MEQYSGLQKPYLIYRILTTPSLPIHI